MEQQGPPESEQRGSAPAQSTASGARKAPRPGHGFGTAPVFLTSLSTILGAILFLRFGYAVGHIGLGGTLVMILLAHLVTIPTVLAVSEIATNRRVAGGGAYFIISRSFGPRIGGSIGIALYLSQAVSIAFYLVAFAEAFQPVLEWAAAYGISQDPRWISLPSTVLLVVLILTRGADLGVRGLYAVCVVLACSIAAFLFGAAPDEIKPDGMNIAATIDSPDSFGVVFATCFPAFTGMIAGLGLSGDLKDPQRSIPIGTTGATLAGMAIYIIAAIKLARSATPEALAADQFIMSQIALWGPSVYVGLAAAALSSALGSLLVAPRTLQALARDAVLPSPRVNRFLAVGRGASQEPVNGTYVSGALALVFVALGGVDFIAQILSMFFMVTYGVLCAVSFLEYFAGNPSYRPTFHTRWYVSLIGAVMCGMMMMQMSVGYTVVSLLLMTAIYLGLLRSRRGERDLTAMFQGTMFQLTRRLQIAVQQSRVRSTHGSWRPSVVAITRDGEGQLGQFDLLRWICHRHGFGQFIQYIPGEYTFASELDARTQLERLIERSALSRSGIFVDTLISPSFRLAVSQTLQLPGISGLPNNSILLEFDRDHPTNLDEVVEGTRIASTSQFNALILRSTKFRFGYRSKIHLWLTEDTLSNAPLMLILAYIIVGHPEWRQAEIRLFAGFSSENAELEAERLSKLMEQGRLPISKQKVTLAEWADAEARERQVLRHSFSADLLIAGITPSQMQSGGLSDALAAFRAANDVLFVHASERIAID